MKSIQRFLIAILLVTGFAGATFAQHGPGDGPGNGGPGKHGRGNPDHLNLSDSCWGVFLSQIPQDSAAMLTQAIECLKNNHDAFAATWKELRDAHQAHDSAKIAELRARLAELRAQRAECSKTIRMILRQYHYLISRIRKDCDNPRRDSIGHHRSEIDIKVGPITPNPVPTGQTTAVLTYGLKVDAHVVITISDQLGNVVKEVFTGDLTAGMQQQTLDLTGLTAGMYYVRVQAGAGVGTARLIIQ
jgi:type IX secretion system substrate protein